MDPIHANKIVALTHPLMQMKINLLFTLFILAIHTSCSSDLKKTGKEADPLKTTINMNPSKNYSSTFSVAQSPEKVFQAIMDFRSWWSEEIEGITDKLNETFFYHYKDVHLCKVKLIELVPDKKLVYQVIENEFNFIADKTEWVNSRLVFDISTSGDQTTLLFTHEGLSPEHACYTVCEDAWNSYIQGSLKSLIETGTGRPNPKEGGLNEELVEKWGLPRK